MVISAEVELWTAVEPPALMTVLPASAVLASRTVCHVLLHWLRACISLRLLLARKGSELFHLGGGDFDGDTLNVSADELLLRCQSDDQCQSRTHPHTRA
eukprot:1967171-Amphidinium_carterae.1